MKKNNIFGHALLMVKKNKRSYLMLSITIMMSFTFLLSFLIYTDSKIMTNNVETIEQKPYMIESYLTGVDKKIKYTYINNLDKLDKTKYFMSDNVVLESKFRTDYDFTSVILTSNNDMGTFLGMNYEIVREDGKKISLSSNQVMVRSSIYEQLKKEKKDKKIILNIPIETNDGSYKYVNVEVVGGYKPKNEKDNISMNNEIIMSQDTLKNIDYSINETRMFIYTHYPTKVLELANNFDIFTKSVFQDKKEKFPEIQKDLKSKGMIVVVLFILLGINLYSSFVNALNERKFEIGVKRAIGASGKDIIMQFLFEGIIVVLSNIVLSSLLAVSIFIGYKYYNNMIKGSRFIFYLSKYSICMYLVVSIFLTMAFSLMFAIQSSRVEIIKYIKGE